MSEQQASGQIGASIATSETYVDAARRGKHTWPRYLFGILLILFFGQVIGATASLILQFALTGSTALTPTLAVGGAEGYALFMVFFPFYLAGIVLAVVLIHRRSPRTLVTPESRINIKRVAQGFGSWFLIMCAFALVSFILDPSIYAVRPDPAVFVTFALVALILTPIQTTTEELFFRGYLVQEASLISRSPIFLIVVSGVLFMLPYLTNPEVGAGFITAALYYLASGVFLALISLKDGTIELAIGIHAANNLFNALVLSYSGSAFGSVPSLFYTDRFDPASDLVSFLLICVLFYVLIFPALKRRHSAGGRAGAS